MKQDINNAESPVQENSNVFFKLNLLWTHGMVLNTLQDFTVLWVHLCAGSIMNDIV